MTTTKQSLITRSISAILAIIVAVGIVPCQVLALEKTQVAVPELSPSKEYMVSVSIEDPQYEIPSYVHTQAVVKADENKKLSMQLTFTKDWKDNTVTSFSMYQVEGSNDPQDLKAIEIKPASGQIGWKDIAGTAEFKLPYYGMEDKYTGTYELSNGIKDSYTLTVDWNSVEEKDPSVKTPVITPNGGNIDKETEVSISCETQDAQIYYTLNGDTPTAESIKYTGSFKISKTTTVKAVAVKEGMGTSQQAEATFTFSILGDINSASAKTKSGYTTLTLIADDKKYADAVFEDKLSASEYYIKVTQNGKEEKFIYNGGLGGFTVASSESEVKLLLNFDGKWDLSAPMTLDIVMADYSTKHIELDMSDLQNIKITKQEDTDAQQTGGQQISINDMKPGNTYTGSFQALRIDDGQTESMLSGFFDKNVEIRVAQDGSMTASFCNTVYAHSMLDFAIQGSDGVWKGAIKNGSRVPETDASGTVVTTVYTLPIPKLDGKDMVGGVNVQAMGGSEAMNGMYDRYTQVKLVFNKTVTEGFDGFLIKNSGMTQPKIVNRALMTIKGLDADKDGYITDNELKSYRFANGFKTLDLSSSKLMEAYGVFDEFKIQDISWLKKLGDKSLETINFNGNNIAEIHSELKGFDKLTSLDLSANCISKIDDTAFSDLTSLTDLKLSSNLLTSINDKVFAGLDKVGQGQSEYVFDLENNRISHIADGAFDDMKNITGLYLARNQLVKLNPGVLPQRDNFTWLSLSDNQLTQIPEGLNKLKNLTSLYLDQNNIEKMGTALDGLNAINKIDISDNLLDEIPESVLTANPTLTSLNTAKNSIKTVPVSILKKIAENSGDFVSVFENNAVDLSKCDLSSFNDSERKTIENAYNEYPSKNELGMKLEVSDKNITYNSQLSGFDYYFWSLCKGGYVSFEIKEKIQQVLGKDSIDSAEELLKFKKVNLPDFTAESIKNSILTDSTGTVDSFSIKTELQELRNGTWYTVDEKVANQTQDDLTNSFNNDSFSAKGRYRLVKTAKGTRAEHRIVVYAGEGDGTTSDKNDLEDGIYSVNVDMYQTDRDKLSMSNNAIHHIVKLEVINNEYFVTLDFKGMSIENRFGYLSKLSYYDEGYIYSQYGKPQGKLVLADVLSTQKNPDASDVIDQYNDKDNLYPDLVKIKLVSTAVNDKDGFVPLHVFVPIMEAISTGTGDQDVLMKIDWSTLKKTDENDPNFKPEAPVEQSPALNYTDSATGVTVHADKGVFEKDVQIVVSEITKGADYDTAASALKDVGKKFKLYDVKFLNAQGDEVIPNGKIQIGFPVAKGYEADKVSAYRMQNNSKVLVKGSLHNGYYTVITKSAGRYALVEKGSTITDADNSANVGSDIPQTGDSTNALPFALLAIASAGMIGVLFVSRKRKFTEGE